MKKAVSWVVLVLVGLSGSTVADDPDERSATFVGSSMVKHEQEYCNDIHECYPIVQGAAIFACPEKPIPWSGVTHDGWGGVLFCRIPLEAQIEMEFTHLLGPLGAGGTVTCPMTDPDGGFDNVEIGTLSDEGPSDLEVPGDCDEAGDPWHPGTTDIAVFVHTADIVDPMAPAVYAPIEGEIALRVLSTGGSG